MPDAKTDMKSGAKHALAHFLELADKGPALRAALVEEVASLLAAWPADYPPEMRLACEALLEKASHELAEADARVSIGRQTMPALSPRKYDTDEGDLGLVACARTDGDFPRIFAERVGISHARADGIFADRSADALATACKGAHIGRPAFSAIAMLAGDGRLEGDTLARLAAYDAVSSASAERTLNAWRAMDRFAHAAE